MYSKAVHYIFDTVRLIAIVKISQFKLYEKKKDACFLQKTFLGKMK